MATPKVIVQLYPVLPAENRADREHRRPLGRNSELYHSVLHELLSLVDITDEAEQLMEHTMIKLAVAPERTPVFTVRSVLGGQYWIQLDDDLWSRHRIAPPARPNSA